MAFTDDLWTATADLRASIDSLPFVRGLADGTLTRDRFDHYMAQDALYLVDYCRTMAALAAAAQDAEEIMFWLEESHGALVAERELHAAHVEDFTAAEMTPTTRAYTSYLLSLVPGRGYAVAAAGILPCFWIYSDEGARLLAAAGDLTDHPYGDWISAYADPAFAASTFGARRIVDAIAGRVDPVTRQAMADAFVTACRYEWMFWDAAWRMEGWVG